MKTIAAQEIKRRGIVAVDGWIGQGPVYIVKNNHLRYVVMSESEYECLMDDLAEARLAASERDLKAGRVRKGSAAQLLEELRRQR
jgi:PHD/YefM family antitoxin component YafN of YafNO toxin-antitoxin module